MSSTAGAAAGEPTDTVRLTGRVTLDVEATVPADELEDEEHAENILKGGFYGTRTHGIAVEVLGMERRPGGA